MSEEIYSDVPALQVYGLLSKTKSMEASILYLEHLVFKPNGGETILRIATENKVRIDSISLEINELKKTVSEIKTKVTYGMAIVSVIQIILIPILIKLFDKWVR